MACLGLRTCGGLPAHNPFSSPETRPKTRFCCPPKRVTLPPAMAVAGCLPVHQTQYKTAGGGGTHVGGGSEKFDRWMKDSVVEIVKNLQEAPLFVHVYGGGVKTETAVAEEWNHRKNRWVKGEEPSPEGIILVEEINVADDDDNEKGKMGILEREEEEESSSTKAWGVLIQGKGEDGGVACYLLKTSKVGGSNIGLFCTHYCLVKVKSFRETAKSQLTNCWLV